MALLPLIGAGLGGFEAYRRSGGDLGATALGAGLGAVTPAGLRLAGTALGGYLGASGLGARLATGLTGQATKLAGITAGAPGTLKGGLAAEGAKALTGLGKAAVDPKLLGGLTAGVGTLGLGLPGMAGSVASGLAGAGQQMRQTGAGLVATPRPGDVVYGGAALPPGLDKYGGIEPEGTPTDVLLGSGLSQRLQYLKDVEAARDAMRLLNPEIAKAAEFRSKQELARQMAAAGIRQNIATRAQMLQNAQVAGLGMGATAAQQAGGALTAQYQYQ